MDRWNAFGFSVCVLNSANTAFGFVAFFPVKIFPRPLFFRCGRRPFLIKPLEPPRVYLTRLDLTDAKHARLMHSIAAGVRAQML